MSAGLSWVSLTNVFFFTPPFLSVHVSCLLPGLTGVACVERRGLETPPRPAGHCTVRKAVAQR